MSALSERLEFKKVIITPTIGADDARSREAARPVSPALVHEVIQTYGATRKKVSPDQSRRQDLLRLMGRNASQEGHIDTALALRGEALLIEGRARGYDVDRSKTSLKEETPKGPLHELEQTKAHVLYAADAITRELDSKPTDSTWGIGTPITPLWLQEETVEGENGPVIKKIPHNDPRVEESLAETLAAAGASNEKDITPKSENRQVERKVMDTNSGVVLMLERRLPTESDDKGHVTIWALHPDAYEEFANANLEKPSEKAKAHSQFGDINADVMIPKIGGEE